MTHVLLFLVTAAAQAGAGLVAPATFAPEQHQATVLVFVATECPIANASAPTLMRLAAEFQDDDVAFFRVYADIGVEPGEIEAHGRDYGFTFPAIHDASQTLARRAGATRVPEAAVFDAAGELVYRGRIDNAFADFGKRRRHVTEHDLHDAITAVLAGRPVANPRTDALGCFIAFKAPEDHAEHRDKESEHGVHQSTN